MADTKTFGLKVPEELHKEASNIMKLLDLSGEDFLNEMIRAYKSERTKEKIPLVAKDLKELQVLTGRIYDMYLNLSYGIENISRSKEDEMNDKLEKKESIIISLQDKVNELTEKTDMLTSSFNNAIEDKNNLDKQVYQLTEVIESNKALITEYKEKNDTLSGLVNEYKFAKDENVELKESLNKANLTNLQVNNDNVAKGREIEQLKNSISEVSLTVDSLKEQNRIAQEELKAEHGSYIEKLNSHHKSDIEKTIQDITRSKDAEKREEILNLKEEQQEKILLIQNQYQNRINEYQDKYKSLLEELEQFKALHGKESNKTIKK